MPRKIINYTNTIIYKIVCNDLNITDLYVGSTTDFTNRKYNHKSSCNNEKIKNIFIILKKINSFDLRV